MIYTITFNPSLDYIMQVPDFKEGETNRSVKEDMYPGGKGFNVSTILQRLGYQNTALGFIAGFTGQQIKKELAQRGFICDLCELEEGMTRINIKMKGDKETEINGNGPFISQKKLDELISKIDTLKKGDTLILAGSIPSSLPDDIYEKIMDRLKDKEIRILVDATKQLLLNALPYKPFLIKPNLRELEEIFQTEINNQKELISYAKKLQEQGAMNVLVSLGKDGALLIASDQKVYYCPGAKGTLINSVGSGDSMVAGFLAGYLKHHDYSEALRLGSACGGATAFSKDLAHKETIDDIYQQLKTEVIQ
ncbi:MAG: 1-phosphofructokinase [Beduini sp.]|uniref:1-phosphofructokinase n=2 Tax=Beduini sp. TaxID=1922300 RepID=UPI0011CA2FE1